MMEDFEEEFVRVGSAETFLNALNDAEEEVYITLTRSLVLTGEAITIDKRVVVDTAGSNISYVNPQTTDSSVFEIVKDGELIIFNSSSYSGSASDTSVIDIRNKRSINEVNIFTLLGDKSYLEDEQPKLTLVGNLTLLSGNNLHSSLPSYNDDYLGGHVIENDNGIVNIHLENRENYLVATGGTNAILTYGPKALLRIDGDHTTTENYQGGSIYGITIGKKNKETGTKVLITGGTYKDNEGLANDIFDVEEEHQFFLDMEISGGYFPQIMQDEPKLRNYIIDGYKYYYTGGYTEIREARILYVNYTSGTDNTSAIRGEYNYPYKTINYAVGRASSGDVIRLQSSIPINSSRKITVNKNIKIETADIDIDGNPIDFKARIYRSGWASGDNIDLIRVSAGRVLTLENIDIDGARTYAGNVYGANIFLAGTTSNKATLIIKEGTILRRGNHTYGGGAVRIENGRFEMYGGEITENFNKAGNTSAIGSPTSQNNKWILMGGLVHNNISTTRALLIGPDNIIGGDFTIKDNYTTTSKTTQQNFPVGRTLYIDETYEGELYVNYTDPERFKEVDIEYLGEGLMPEDGTIRPQHNPNLHAEISDDKIIWDYVYEEFVVHKEPTLTNDGEIREKAIIDGGTSETIYNNDGLPKLLNTNDYEITYGTDDSVNFDYLDKSQGDFSFEYTYEEFEDLVYDGFGDYLDKTDEKYLDLIEDLINQAIDEVDDQTKIEDLVDHFFDYIKEAEEIIEAEKLREEKESAETELEDFVNDLSNDISDELEDIISDYEEQIKNAESVEEVKDILEEAKNEIINQQIKEIKDQIKEALETYDDEHYPPFDLEDIDHIILEQQSFVDETNFEDQSFIDSLIDDGKLMIDIFRAKQKLEKDLLEFIDFIGEDLTWEAEEIVLDALE